MKKILFLLLLICLTVNTAISLLPDHLESIGDEAFYGDMSLDVVTIPGTVRTIGSKAFSNSSVKEVHVDGNATIADDAFANTNPKFFTPQNTTVFTWALSHGFAVRSGNTEYQEGEHRGWFHQETQYDAITGEENAYQCTIYTDRQKTDIVSTTIRTYNNNAYTDRTHDGNGNQIGYGTTIFKSDGSSESTGYGYNGDGKPSSYEYHDDSSGNCTYYEYVIYDDDQRSIVRTKTVRDYNVSGAIIYIEYVYDGNGTVTSTTRYNANGSSERTWMGVNGDGDPFTRTDRYDSNGKQTDSEFITYQDAGRTIVKSRTVTVYNVDGSSLYSEFWEAGNEYCRRDWKYDKDGKIVGDVITYVYSDPDYKNLVKQY